MTIKDIEEKINNKYKELIEKLNNNIVSIFIIGSMRDEKQELKKYNDYDLRILVKNIDKYTYQAIKEFNEEIKQIISQNFDIDVDYSFIIGPVRYITKSKINLLIHCIPMTEGILDNLPLTHKYSYASNYRIIYGEDVLEKYKTIRYTGNDIITCTEGIDYCINMIQNNKIQYDKFEESKETIEVINESKKMDDCILFEVLRYSISKSLDNTMKWNTWNGRNSYTDFYLKVKEIDYSISTEIIRKMENLINGKYEEYEKNIKEYKYITINFLNKIKQYILERQ